MRPSGEDPRSWTGRPLHRGRGSGQVLKLDLPLSFWGGVGRDGTVIDRHHPQYGANLAGRVLAMTTGRGSSSSSSVLAELLRVGAAPSAILLIELDAIIALGAIVADELYGVAAPVVQLAAKDHQELVSGMVVTVEAKSQVAVIRIPRR